MPACHRFRIPFGARSGFDRGPQVLQSRLLSPRSPLAPTHWKGPEQHPKQLVYEHFDTAGTAFGLVPKQKLEEVQTEYQHIEMWETDSFGYLMTIDGATMLTTRDNFLYHEMMSHLVLFSHANPKRVVIIGGGDRGTLLLRHPGVEKATQIDIDEMVTRYSEFSRNCASPTTTHGRNCCLKTACNTCATAQMAAWT